MAMDSGRDEQRTAWPHNLPFAFTVVDDTDFSTLTNARPVYDLLLECGMRTTKTVWPLAPTEAVRTGGATLADPEYLGWVLELQASGVEIAYHGATDHTSDRARSRMALERYGELLGEGPRLYAAHTGQQEALYWHSDRLAGLPRVLYQAIQRRRGKCSASSGHIQGNALFWGDMCRDQIEYMRNFTFVTPNTLSCDRLMPYHDASRPWVRYWFSASQGQSRRPFCSLISEANQDALAASGGLCLIYTHFGAGFAPEGRLDPTFVRLIRRLAGLGGWIAPASTILDHLRSLPGHRDAPKPSEIRRLEWRWLLGKVRHGAH